MIKLNPDRNHVLEIKKAIEEYGGYCPCSLIQDNDHKCPCKEFRETNECHCGLYVNIND
jgi:ferredoxin-thioredoxin reductase catalytic subunit